MMPTLEPLRLSADNFTPASRTPWGGKRIRGRLKQGLLPVEEDDAIVGESWEFSVAESFPSRVVQPQHEAGKTLREAVSARPDGWLGGAQSQALGMTPLLVKLIDAADDLSLQVHPKDDYKGLSEGQSGKFECWYILERDEGAGIYLGWREGVQKEQVAHCLAEGSDLSQLLAFVPVEPGDFIVLPEGLAHAIGRGVMLLEPQRVQPGADGVTYRFWDWNRRYDAEGRRTPDGKPRPLHVEDALAVSDWDGPREGGLLARVRRRAGRADLGGAARAETLWPAALDDDRLKALRLTGSGELVAEDLTADDCQVLRSLTVLEGRMQVGQLSLREGESAAIPAGWSLASCKLHGAHAVVCAAP